MNELISMLLEGVSKAFNLMKTLEILPGVNLLSIFLSLLVISVLLDVVIIKNNNSNKGGRSD